MKPKLSAAALRVLRDPRTASSQGTLSLEADASASALAVEIYCDGASRGNPGPAGAGALVLELGTGKVLARCRKALGRATNNEAEYAALLLGLQEARSMKAARVSVYADSELVIKQLNGVYRVKHPVMQQRHQEAMRLLAQFQTWRATHVPRERNAEADRLANEALDFPA